MRKFIKFSVTYFLILTFFLVVGGMVDNLFFYSGNGGSIGSVVMNDLIVGFIFFFSASVAYYLYDKITFGKK
jgi:hypothetical protein